MRIRTDNQLKNDEKLRTKFLRLKAFEDAKIAIQVYEESLLEEKIIAEPIYTEKEIEKIDIESIPVPPPETLKRVRSRKIFYPYDVIEDENNKIINIINK